MNFGKINDILYIFPKFSRHPAADNLPYILNGPIQLFFIGYISDESANKYLV
jgi:hypothetical protein